MEISQDTILEEMKASVEDVFTTMLDTVAELIERGQCHRRGARLGAAACPLAHGATSSGTGFRPLSAAFGSVGPRGAWLESVSPK